MIIKNVMYTLHESTEELLQSPILNEIERGIDPEFWREFAKQRYLAATGFLGLLEGCVDSARTLDDSVLCAALEKNLREEKGLNSAGEMTQAGSHEKWRQDFYSALGITEGELRETEPLDGTAEYACVLSECTASRDSFLKLGVLLGLEHSIPEEFEKLKRGRDKTFPEIFLDGNGDSYITKKEKRRRRLYLDHHVYHDRRFHFPELFNALKLHMGDAEKLKRLQQGINRIGAARVGFYR